MKSIVVLLLIAYLPGMPEPIQHQRQVISIDECLKEVKAFLYLPPNVVLQEGGYIQATCHVEVPAPVEH